MLFWIEIRKVMDPIRETLKVSKIHPVKLLTLSEMLPHVVFALWNICRRVPTVGSMRSAPTCRPTLAWAVRRTSPTTPAWSDFYNNLELLVVALYVPTSSIFCNTVLRTRIPIQVFLLFNSDLDSGFLCPNLNKFTVEEVRLMSKNFIYFL
jgi:hypothetical protein